MRKKSQSILGAYHKIVIKIFKDNFEFKTNQTKDRKQKKKIVFLKRVGRKCRLI